MTISRKKAAFIPFILALVLSAAVIVTELIMPLDRLHTAADEEYQNTANGGKVCVDGSITYFVSSNGSIRGKGNAADIKIDDGGDMIQAYENGIVYRRDGNVMYADFGGANKRVVLKNVGDFVLSGNWIYYTEQDQSRLKKQRVNDGKQFDLGIDVHGQFAVRGNTVLFIGEKSYLYTARTDGSGVKPFLGRTADSFMFYASFVYFMHDGEIWSTANRNTASVLRYGAADAFTVYDNTLFYISDGVVYSRDLSDEEAKPVKLAIKGGDPRELYVSEDWLYCYFADGTLIRCDFSGAGSEKL